MYFIFNRNINRYGHIMKSLYYKYPYLINAVVVFFLVLSVFCISLGYDFLNWDDARFVTYNANLDFTWENLKLFFTTPFLDICSPLTLVSFMFDHAVAPNSAFVCRLHNLLLHAFSAVLLVGIGKELRFSRGLTVLVALLWAVNPQKVESVCWISERKDVLCGFLAFAAIYAFIISVRRNRLPWAAAILCVLSILAKPASLTIAGVLFVYLVCKWRKKHSIRDYIRFFAPVAVLNLLAIIYSFAITFQTNPGHPTTNLIVPIHNIFWYPVTTIFPFLPMTPCAVYPPVPIFGKAVLSAFTAGFILLLAIVIIAHRLRHRIPMLYIGGWTLAILCMIAPVAGMLDYTNFTHCDRYNYIVSAIVLFALWGFATRCINDLHPWTEKARHVRQRCAYLVGFLLFGAFYIGTIQYIPQWESAETLFRGIIEKSIRYGNVPPNIHTVQNAMEYWLNYEESEEHKVLIDLLLHAIPEEAWDCYKSIEGQPVHASLLLARIHQMPEDDPEAQAMARDLLDGIKSRRYAIFSSLTEIYLKDMIRFCHVQGDTSQENEIHEALIRYQEQHPNGRKP